jgi:hypothetical protein
MNIEQLGVTQEQAREALLEYKRHRSVYDSRDWEIERIYRQIAKGRTVISAGDAIRKAGIDELGRPRLALMRADQEFAVCNAWWSEKVVFSAFGHSRAADLNVTVSWPNRPRTCNASLQAALPRIPPQHRPAQSELSKYHTLWEADWTDLPHDPMLLKRIGKDAWIVLAAWDLTDVEMSVLRAHRERQ